MHSRKPPSYKRTPSRSQRTNLYRESADALRLVLAGRSSVKGATLRKSVSNKKATYSLVLNTVKYLDVLEEIITRTGLLERCGFEDMRLAMILVYEITISRKWPTHPDEIAGKVLRHAKLLRTTLREIREERGVDSALMLLPTWLRTNVGGVRHVRLNILKAVDLESLSDQELALESTLLRDVYRLSDPSREMYNHTDVRERRIIIQDFSSCIPALVLDPSNGSTVVDACAAPGNKTTQLAALLKDSGKVVACDLNKHRFELLKRNVRTSGATNVLCQNLDFRKYHESGLFCDLKDPVLYILLDPSCSSSGQIDKFELSIVREVLRISKSKFESSPRSSIAAADLPSDLQDVERVVYSTCSIFREENEEVVKWVFEAHPRISEEFKIAHALKEWKTRGEEVLINGIDESEKFVRVNPFEDGATGFFVCLFERISGSKKRKRESGCVSSSVDNVRDRHESVVVSSQKVAKVDKMDELNWLIDE